MAQIGQFTRTESGFTGRLHTLILYRELALVPATPSDSENAPDYRIHHGDEDGPEIGAFARELGADAEIASGDTDLDALTEQPACEVSAQKSGGAGNENGPAIRVEVHGRCFIRSQFNGIHYNRGNKT